MNCHTIIILLLKERLFYVIVAPKHTSSFAGKSEMPSRSSKVPSLGKKVKGFDLIRKENMLYAEVAHIYLKVNLLFVKL